MYQNKVIRLPHGYHNPYIGQFGMKYIDWGWGGNSKDVSWISCREELHMEWGKYSRELFYCHRIGQGKSIAAFISRVEKKLGIKTPTEFGPTQRNKISWIKLSPWWCENSLRKNLFTILLRAGLKYNTAKRNFNQALWTERYVVRTKEAVERFMSGYNRIVWPKDYSPMSDFGWCKAFEYEEKLESILVKGTK